MGIFDEQNEDFWQPEKSFEIISEEELINANVDDDEYRHEFSEENRFKPFNYNE